MIYGSLESPANLEIICEDWKNAEVVTLFKKGNRLDPGNYQGIFLLDVAGKILSSIVAERISQIAEKELSDEQCGFRKRRSTSHQCLVLRRLQEECRKARVPLAACFIDFKKAFDSPPRAAILEALKWIGTPPKLVKLVGGIHEGARAKVLGTSAWFCLLRGVRQGCVLGPLLFNVLLEYVLRGCPLATDGLGVNLVCRDRPGTGRPACPPDLLNVDFRVGRGAYADDVYMVGSIHAVEAGLQRLMAFAGSIGLDVSVAKTEWMHLYTDTPCRTLPGTQCGCQQVRTRDGLVIQHVKEFTYLGSLLTEEGGCTPEVRRRVTLAERKLVEISWCFKAKIRRRRMIRMCKTFIWPVLLYGCEAWSLSVSDYDILEVFLNKVRLRILDRFRMIDGAAITNQELRSLVRLPSAACLVISRQLRFLLKLMKGDSSETARRMVFAEIAVPNGRTGGCPVVYPRCVLANVSWVISCLRKHGLVGAVEERCPELAREVAGADLMKPPDIARAWRALVAMDSSVSCRLINLVMRSEAAVPAEEFQYAPSVKQFHAYLSNFKCEKCDACFTEHKALLRHVRQAHEPPNLMVYQCQPEELRRFQCLHCNLSYKTHGWLMRHYKAKHPNAQNPDPMDNDAKVDPGPPQGTPVQNSTTCTICGRGGKVRAWSLKTLKNHMASVHRVNLATGEASRNRRTKS